MAALILLFLSCMASLAANHYVRAAASGSADGSDWINAWTNLPASLTRGDTYYIGDGAYQGYTLDDANSGAAVISIKKATQSDHGTETGWDSGYGDGTAEFVSTLTFSTDYWLLDGQSRSTWTNGYGFKVSISAGGGKNITINGSHTTVRYLDCQGSGPDDVGSPSNDGFYLNNAGLSNTFQYLHVHDQGRAPFIINTQTNCIVEYCFVARNETDAGQHSEGVSSQFCDGIIFRYNIWEDIEGTGIIVAGNASGVVMFGNLCYWTTSYPNAGQAGTYTSNGSFTSWTDETLNNSFFYHNTIILPATGGLSFTCSNLGAGTNNAAVNNLYFCNGSIGSRLGYAVGTSHSYNAYSGSGDWSSGETGVQTNITSSFLNASYQLLINTDAGSNLGATYSVDMNGRTRITWSRGAYEFVAPQQYFNFRK